MLDSDITYNLDIECNKCQYLEKEIISTVQSIYY